MHFAVRLYQSGVAAATISSTLATVCFAAKADGWQEPCTDFCLQRALQEWVCGRPHPKAVVLLFFLSFCLSCYRGMSSALC